MRSVILLCTILFVDIAERTLDITPLTEVNNIARGAVVGLGLVAFIIMDTFDFFKKGGTR
ncbi:hypothetical protein KAR91_34585 [Candidatus Pacearchaeota archaeon]|nr:hypothetical protein [Candidatus Pacearchaeota archaeon]